MKKVKVLVLISMILALSILSTSAFAATDTTSIQVISQGEAKEKIDSVLKKYLPKEIYQITISDEKANPISLSELENKLELLKTELASPVKTIEQPNGVIVTAYPSRLEGQIPDFTPKYQEDSKLSGDPGFSINSVKYYYSLVRIGHSVTPNIKSIAAATYFYDSIRQRYLFSDVNDIDSYINGTYVVYQLI